MKGQTGDMSGHGSPRDVRSLTLSADVANLGQIREFVAGAARDNNACEDTIEELQLVVSELATNAMHYNDADTVSVGVQSDGSSWTIEVSNADNLGELKAPELPEPSALTGRGLFLVDAMMDKVELVDVDGRLHIRCVKFASGARDQGDGTPTGQPPTT